MIGFRIALKTLTHTDKLKEFHYKNSKTINDQTIIDETIVDKDNQCSARIWDGGTYGNTQCSHKVIDNCLCEMHLTSTLRMPNNKWWLGLINETRPENPYHPIAGYHKWKYDVHGNEIIEIKPEEIKKEIIIQKPKKPRGRPLGSKNKKNK